MKHARSPQGAQALPRQEELLLDYAERLRRQPAGRRAVHIHLSSLQAHNRREQHLRVVANSFDNLIQRYEGQCFVLSNNDLVVVLREAPVSQIDDVVLRLRYLFSDDPAVSREETEGPQSSPFCTWYDLEKDAQDFIKMARMMLTLADQGGALPVSGDHTVAQTEKPKPKIPFNADYLHRLIKAIETTDLASFLVRQKVAALVPGSPPKPVFNEIYVSMEELRRRLLPDIDLFSSRWLFQCLTEAIDLRLLRQLPELERDIHMSTSLNLNMATLMTDEFLDFDRSLRQYAKKSMVIELQSIDVFSNIGGFHFLREFLRERGYKVCLDGLNHLTFPLLRCDEIDVDFYKIIWSRELLEMDGSVGLARFREAVNRAKTAHAILCRCDDEQAIPFAQGLGITLYQGRLIDGLMAPVYRPEMAQGA